MQKSHKKPVVLLISSLMIVIIIGLALGYYFGWRTSDASYLSEIENVKSLQSNAKSVSSIYDNLRGPIYFDDTSSLESYTKAVDSYQATLKSISASNVVTKDSIVKAEFDKDKPALTTYETSINNTASAVKIYYTILQNCGSVRFIALAPITASQIQSCYDAIKQETSLPESGFKSNFLDKYAATVNSMLDTLLAPSTTDAIKKQKNTMLQAELDKLYSTNIDYELVNPPTSELNNLSSTLNIQKSKLLR